MDELHNLMSVGKSRDMILQKLFKMSSLKNIFKSRTRIAFSIKITFFQGPATATGLEVRKGLFEPGFDADMVVWDPSVSNKSQNHTGAKF